eukprot:1756665-Prymnesium_polylepis.1
MFELLKNSLRAVAEHHGVNAEMPPVKVLRLAPPTRFAPPHHPFCAATTALVRAAARTLRAARLPRAAVRPPLAWRRLEPSRRAPAAQVIIADGETNEDVVIKISDEGCPRIPRSRPANPLSKCQLRGQRCPHRPVVHASPNVAPQPSRSPIGLRFVCVGMALSSHPLAARSALSRAQRRHRALAPAAHLV